VKNVPPSLPAALRSKHKVILAGTFAFSLLNGTTAYYTDQQADLVVPSVGGGSVTYLGGGVGAGTIGISGLKLAQKIGLDAEEQSIAIAYRPISDPAGPSTIGGQAWVNAIRLGLLDKAYFTWGIVALDSYGAVPIGWGEACPDGTGFGGICTLFRGRVSQIKTVGAVQSTLQVKSDLVVLEQDMPHRTFGPGCCHTLYDSGCGLAKAAFTSAGTVNAGSTGSLVLWTGAGASYAQGTITFLSGRNAGASASIGAAASGSLALAYPLQFAPAAGDTFEASFGCDKTMATCTTRFNNLLRFLGFPFVPPPEDSV
jgi:hypothetical protein